MTYEQHGSGGYPASPDIEHVDLDCPEPFIEEGCQMIDSNGDLKDCPFMDAGFCTKDDQSSEVKSE